MDNLISLLLTQRTFLTNHPAALTDQGRVQFLLRLSKFFPIYWIKKLWATISV